MRYKEYGVLIVRSTHWHPMDCLFCFWGIRGYRQSGLLCVLSTARYGSTLKNRYKPSVFHLYRWIVQPIVNASAISYYRWSASVSICSDPYIVKTD